jgi:hypothetical protein
LILIFCKYSGIININSKKYYTNNGNNCKIQKYSLNYSKGDPEIAAFIMGLLIKNAELVTQLKELESQVIEKGRS